MEHRPFLEWNRAEKRRGMNVPGVAYRADGNRSTVVVSELSYDGCRLLASDSFTVGECVTLVVMSLGAEINATVRWARQGKVGLRFADGAA